MAMVEQLLTAEDAPVLNESLDNTLIIMGLPTAGPEKIGRLQRVLLDKVFGELEVNLTLATDEDGSCKGFCFAEFNSPKEAYHALHRFQNFALDKKHVLKVALLSQCDQIEATPDTFVAPPDEEYDEEQDNLQSWLLQPDAHDQFFAHHGNKITVAYNTRDSYDVVEEREGWTDRSAAWSPQGTYMATLHRKGIALWGTPKWKRLQRFAHPGVRLIDFSPKEGFLVSWSSEVADNPKDPQAIIVWDIKTGTKRRGFKAIESNSWPVFRWSHDDRYFARQAENAIAIYDSKTMTKLNKQSVAVPGIKTFAWSPSDNIISYWTPEAENRPARVVLMSVPDLQEVGARNLMGVTHVDMYWQKSGEHFAVKANRTKAKGKKKEVVDLELFHVRAKDVPCYHVELENPVTAFFWEPIGKKFAICENEGTKKYVTFYGIEEDKVPVLERFEKAANAVFWSPRGQFCIMAEMGNVGGMLDFLDTSNMTVMNMGEHTMCSDIQWDPTGRYAVSIVSYLHQKVDTGYIVWNFQGKALQKHVIEGFYQLLWRPRPPSLLTKPDLKSIKKNWKVYETEFEAADKLLQSKASREEIAKRRQMRNEWLAYMEKLRERTKEILPQLKALRPDLVDESQEVEEEVMVLVSDREEVVG